MAVTTRTHLLDAQLDGLAIDATARVIDAARRCGETAAAVDRARRTAGLRVSKSQRRAWLSGLGSTLAAAAMAGYSARDE